MRVEKVTEVCFQGFEVALEEFVERSVSHRRRVINDSDFGISNLGFSRGLTKSTST
jgi:hypothetical protein